MSDIVQIAAKYRSRLRAELVKVEEFLRMAEELARERDLEGRLAFAKPGAEPAAGAAAEVIAKPAAEAKPKPAEEPKTPFDRFRAAGG
jgi:hypothetical protein